MTHHVVILPAAEEDVVHAAAWIGEQGAAQDGFEWIAGIHRAISSLADFPFRCPLAPENDNFEAEIRHLLYGKSRIQYRILYTIQGDSVYILHVRHAARPHLDSENDL